MKCVFVTNIPAPYRETVHEIISGELQGGYHVIYAAKREPDRLWNIEEPKYLRTFLKKGICIGYKGRYIHINLDVWAVLNKLNPEIIITNSFNPTFLIAFLWAKVKRRKHLCMTDGWIKSEESLSVVHKLIRRIVFKNSLAFIGASKHSFNLFKSYSCPEKRMFRTYLCANNSIYFKSRNSEKKYDIIFSGQFIERKMPLFFVEVAKKMSSLLGQKTKALVIGAGPLKEVFLNKLQCAEISFDYAGFLRQEELPQHYSLAKVLLFPTKIDPWGVVANEACAAGIPVITCENAGVSNDLIIHNFNGLILPLIVKVWAEKVVELLNNRSLYEKMAENAFTHAQEYNYNNAAKGIIEAIRSV